MKKKLVAAEECMQELLRLKKNCEAREKRAKLNCKSLISQLKEKNLLNVDLEQKLVNFERKLIMIIQKLYFTMSQIIVLNYIELFLMEMVFFKIFSVFFLSRYFLIIIYFVVEFITP